MSAKRPAAAVVLLAVAGLGVSLVISWVHGKLDVADYTSFCNVNDTVNCNVVLASKYAKIFGIPVAWLAAVAYVAFIAAAVGAARSPSASRRRQLASAILVAAAGAVGFSLYLAYVALAILHAICLLCTALYVVNAALIVAAAFLYTAVHAEGRRAGAGSSGGLARWMAIGAVASLAVVIGAVAYEAGASRDDTDPDFKAWFMAQPLVDAPLPPARHVRGGAAPVVIVEFSDFECGHCARAYREIKSVLPRYGKDVQIVFHHFPLDPACNPEVPEGSGHRNACLAAIAAECASQQNKFWEYHDLLFEHQKSLSRERMLSFADELGLDRQRFEKCLGSAAARQAVERDIAAGERLQVTSTPTMFFNRRIVRGALEGDALASAIRLERALTVAND